MFPQRQRNKIRLQNVPGYERNWRNCLNNILFLQIDSLLVPSGGYYLHTDWKICFILW